MSMALKKEEELTVLADEVQVEAAARVRPQPALGAVEPGAVLVASRQIPERDAHRLPVHPSPILCVSRVSHSTQPILAISIALRKAK